MHNCYTYSQLHKHHNTYIQYSLSGSQLDQSAAVTFSFYRYQCSYNSRQDDGP